VFDDVDRLRYLQSLGAALVPGGRLALLCFSDRVPGDVGPRRVSRDEIVSSFADGWKVLSIDLATMDLTFTPDGFPAWFAVIARD
jgi:hypothetical protein